MMRIGQGYDAHRYANDDRTLVLGGVSFEDERGLEGHSDADVVTHAVIDAMLSAAGLGDIGENFSDNDPLYAGADSVELLKRTAKLVGDICSTHKNTHATLEMQLRVRLMEKAHMNDFMISNQITVKWYRSAQPVISKRSLIKIA